jgi:hypothetical protein
MSMLKANLIALVAGLAMIATAAPADAAKKEKHTKHKTVVAARASAGDRGGDRFPGRPLYYNGNEYLGDDPDPNIRFQLWRDLGAHFGPPE